MKTANDSIDLLMKMNPNVRCAFRMNLNRNTVTEKHAVHGYARKLRNADSVDDFMDTLASLITDEAVAEELRRDYNRTRLLEMFQDGTKECTRDAKMTIRQSGCARYFTLCKSPRPMMSK